MPRKNMYIAVVVAVVVVAIFIFLGFFGVGGRTQESAPVGVSAAQALLNDISKTGSVSALTAIDTVEGTGEAVKSGDLITVKYIGVLPDGTVFDASANHTQIMPPCTEAGVFCFELGAGSVIKGWDPGLVGMKVGGTRILAIPPELAYGERSMGQIPPNSSLIFQVDLVSIGRGQ